MAESKHDYRVPMLLLLSFVTGIVDAVSVLGLDHAFVANMTGNVVFLGFATAGAPGYHWLPLIASIGAFVLGAAAGGKLGRVHTNRTERRWLLIVSAVEAGLLLVATGMCLWQGRGSVVPVLIPMAVAMGLRNATVKRLGVADLSTTVLTLTLTAVGADSGLAGGPSTNWLRRFSAVGAICLGAAVGALLLSWFGPSVPLLSAALLTLAAGGVTLFHSASLRANGA